MDKETILRKREEKRKIMKKLEKAKNHYRTLRFWDEFLMFHIIILLIAYGIYCLIKQNIPTLGIVICSLMFVVFLLLYIFGYRKNCTQYSIYSDKSTMFCLATIGWDIDSWNDEDKKDYSALFSDCKSVEELDRLYDTMVRVFDYEKDGSMNRLLPFEDIKRDYQLCREKLS